MKFDVIVHMIAGSYADAAVAVDAFTYYAGRAVVASSLDVYRAFGGLLGKEDTSPSAHPLDESAPLRQSEYIYGDQRERLEVEQAFRIEAERLPLTILRLPFMYGPDDPRHRFFPHVKRIDDGRPFIPLEPAYGNFRMTHAYVENVAHAFVRAIETPHPTGVPLRIYNVGEPRTPTTAERLHDFARAVAYKGKVVVVPRDRCPAHLVKSGDLRHDIVLDDSAIRRDLGYKEVVPPDEAFRRTIAWQRTVCPLSCGVSEFDYSAEDALLQDLGVI
jgi:nucleoside-diphosphate-sugar epimerase